MKRRRYNGPRYSPLPRFRAKHLKQVGGWFEEFRTRHAFSWLGRAMARTVMQRYKARTIGRWYGKLPTRSKYRPAL